MKFSTDGSALTQVKGAVQSSVRLIDVEKNGKPCIPSNLPMCLQQEICVLIYIGKYLVYSDYVITRSKMLNLCLYEIYSIVSKIKLI